MTCLRTKILVNARTLLPLALLLLLLQAASGRAEIVSEATATGNYQGAPIVSYSALQRVNLEPARPSFKMEAKGKLVDRDGDGFGDLGEKVVYTFTFTNNGNTTLHNLKLVEKLPGISAIICIDDKDKDGDIDTLLPKASAACSANYVITQLDLFKKSIETSASTSANGADGVVDVKEDDGADDNKTSVLIDQIDELVLLKSATAPILVFPNIYEFYYDITVENSGTVTQSNIQLTDDLQAAVVSTGRLISTSLMGMQNFSGPGVLNAKYDGVGDVQLFARDVQLVPGKTGKVRIRVRIDTVGEPFLSVNTAYVTSTLIKVPVASDDPVETPDDATDNNPAAILIFDSDLDGAGNDAESDIDDSDGDGIPDIDDYSPTGNLYCEDDGRILTGGQISIQNLTTSGTQTGIGNSNNITIVKDGSDGQYQFYVSKAGAYRLNLAKLPVGAPLSKKHLAGPPLDLPLNAAGETAKNSVTLGSATNGNQSVLIDSSAKANPYYFDFTLAEFGPVIFDNNIPFSLCTIPKLSVTSSVSEEPMQLPDGSTSITYRLSAENSGTHYARNFQMNSDLAATFGAGNFTIRSIELETVSKDAQITLNPVYDGVKSSNLFTSGTRLNAGDKVSVLLKLNVNVAAGNYLNKIVVSGENPFSGAVLDSVVSEVSAEILRPEELQLAVTAIAGSIDMKLGQQMLLTIAIKNPESFARENGEIIALIPDGFSYVAGSAKLNGTVGEPQISGTELVWKARRFPAGELVVLQISLQLGSAVTSRKFLTKAHVRQSQTGKTISNLATTQVELAIEPVFKCSDIIGRVFHDLNGNGVLDSDEVGLPGIKLGTVGGLRVTTDNFGRFQVACSAIPKGQIGADIDMKLDVATLPTRFHLTSENPIVVRLSLGRLTKISFGATKLREITLGLQAPSFSGSSSRLTPTALGRVARLLEILEEKPSILNIIYADKRDDRAVGDTIEKARLLAVKSLIEAAWAGREGPYKLVVKTEIQ